MLLSVSACAANPDKGEEEQPVEGTQARQQVAGWQIAEPSPTAAKESCFETSGQVLCSSVALALV